MKTSQFNDAVSKLLTEKLKPLAQKKTKLDLVVCVEIYQYIFETLVEIFKSSNVALTNEAMNYLSQQYYDGILINNKHELDPNIFEKRAKLENISTKELALLAVALSGTDFSVPIINEIKKRS